MSKPKLRDSAPGSSGRKPQRISVTIPLALHEYMVELSDSDGRSLSNLAAHWLERQADLQRSQAG